MFDVLILYLFSWNRNDQYNPPPSYLDSTGTITTISSTSTLGAGHLSTTPNIKPSNFVNLNRTNESVKGSWLIDPCLSIPSFFLEPLPTGDGERSNLFLGSKNGAIDADIYLLPTSRSKKNNLDAIIIRTQSDNGSVKTRLVSLIDYHSFLVGIHQYLYSMIQNRWMAKSVLPLDFLPAHWTVPCTFSFHVLSVAPFGLRPLTAALVSQQRCKLISQFSQNWIMCNAAFWVISTHRSGTLESLGKVTSSRSSRRMGV